MGQPAARIQDDVAHRKGSGAIEQGCLTVRIGGDGLLAARKGDRVRHNHGVEVITTGEDSVRIGGPGLSAARMGDKVACKGVIAQACMTVRIGRHEAEDCLVQAHSAGDAIVTGVEHD